MSLRLLHTQWKARLVHPSPSKVVHTLFSFVVVVIDVMVSVILFQSVIIPLVSDFFSGPSLPPPLLLTLPYCSLQLYALFPNLNEINAETAKRKEGEGRRMEKSPTTRDKRREKQEKSRIY